MEKLELRKRIKKKKPEFIRQDAHKRKKLSHSWRRPKGHQSKMRLHLKGYRKNVEVGYGSPKEVRGLGKSGLIEIIVKNIAQLESINKEKEGAVVSSGVGERKKIEILKKAKELGIKILNVKDVDAYIKESEERLNKKKQEKTKKAQKKEEKKKELEKKAEEKEKEGLAEKVSEEEKKDQEKKEKDKVLTKQEK